MEWLRFALTAVLLTGSLLMVLLAQIGVFRFRFVLNRMHTASLIDTCGVLLTVLAAVVAMGLRPACWKLLLLVLLLWMGSPISSHLLARLEVMTDEELSHHLTVEGARSETETKEASEHDGV